MPKKIPRDKNFSQSVPVLTYKKNGFILLEVLVAMSLVAISWIGLGNAYQLLILRLGQEQHKRLKIHQELDQHELQQSRLPINESARVPRRNRHITHTTRPIDQK
jgi:Tfp pilus assembly protein PilV